MSSKTLLRALPIAAILCAMAAGTAFAQAATAQISGRVTDETGAVLPGVTVNVTQTQTGLVRSAVSNEVGAFSFPSLPLGPYRLEAALQGFRSFVQEGITLQVNANLVVDPVLSLGEIAELITVSRWRRGRLALAQWSSRSASSSCRWPHEMSRRSSRWRARPCRWISRHRGAWPPG
jgi:hypothetical protein